MASDFDTLMAAIGVPVLMEHLGDAITYTPAGGAGAAITGILGFEEDREDETLDGRRLRRLRDVTVNTDPADPDYGGVASPALNATVTVGGVQYAVESIVSLSANLVRLALRRVTALEVSRENYRKP